MILCRFGEGRLGLVEGRICARCDAALDLLPTYRYPLPSHDVLIANLDQVIERAHGDLASRSAVALSDG